MKVSSKLIVKAAVHFVIGAGLFATAAYASAIGTAPPNSIGYVADNVNSSLGHIFQMAMAVAYLAGGAFFISGFHKLKQHKDNPQQVPVTTGITMLCLGIGLIFIPTLLGSGGATLFGEKAQSSGPTGVITFEGMGNPDQHQ